MCSMCLCLCPYVLITRQEPFYVTSDLRSAHRVFFLLGAGGFDGHLGCGRIISISPHAFLFLSTLMSCDAQKTSVNAVLSFRNRQPALTDCNYVLPGTRSVCRTKCAGKHCEDYWVVLYKMSITHLACFAPLSRSPGVLLYFFPGN